MLLLICNRELMFILSEKHRQDNAPQGCTTILIGIMSTELTRIVCQILLDIFNVSGWAPLSVWTGERILHGICLYYLNTRDKCKTLELFDLYRQKVSEMEFPSIKDQFERLERYIRDLPDLEPVSRKNKDKGSIIK